GSPRPTSPCSAYRTGDSLRGDPSGPAREQGPGPRAPGRAGGCKPWNRRDGPPTGPDPVLSGAAGKAPHEPSAASPPRAVRGELTRRMSCLAIQVERLVDSPPWREVQSDPGTTLHGFHSEPTRAHWHLRSLSEDTAASPSTVPEESSGTSSSCKSTADRCPRDPCGR